MGHKVMPNEAGAIVRRMDVDGDNRIGYSEFVESISPVCPDFVPAQAIISDRNVNNN